MVKNRPPPVCFQVCQKRPQNIFQLQYQRKVKNYKKNILIIRHECVFPNLSKATRENFPVNKVKEELKTIKNVIIIHHRQCVSNFVKIFQLKGLEES